MTLGAILVVFFGLIAIIIALTVLLRWVREVADLIWMALIRLRPVAAICLGIGLLTLISGLWLGTPLSMALLLSLVLTPLLARPLCDWIAQRWPAGAQGTIKIPQKAAVFTIERERQRSAYSAPSIGKHQD